MNISTVYFFIVLVILVICWIITLMYCDFIDMVIM
jgi:hypothetical protein